MSYRFVKVTSHYREYLKDYYRRNPHIVTKTYAEQMQHIMGEGFGWADFFANHLRCLGVEAYEIIANALPLQQAWLGEHGIQASGKDIIIAQLKALQPDVVFLQDSFRFNGDWITHLKEQVPSIRQVLGWIAAPYTGDYVEQFRSFDYMLSCHPGFCNSLIKEGLRMHQFNHGFEASLLSKISWDRAEQEIDCIFMGSLYAETDFHKARIEMIESLLRANISLKLYGYLQKSSRLKVLLKQGAYIAAKNLSNLGLSGLVKHLPGLNTAVYWNQFPQSPYYSQDLKNIIKAPLYGLDMLHLLSRAKVGLNFHCDVSESYAGNIRLYEVTGVGACLLTDWKENLHELFEVDTEVVTYKSADECLEKSKWLLEHPKEREAIAKAGQARTLNDHTYEKRAAQLNNIIKTGLKK